MAVFDLHLQLRTNLASGAQAALRGAAATLRSAEVGPSVSTSLTLELAGERCDAANRLDHAACLLRDLAEAALALADGRAHRKTVRAYDTAWELSLSLTAGAFLASLYRTGAAPEVRAVDVRLAPPLLVSALRASLDRLGKLLDPTFVTGLDALITRLDAVDPRALEAPARHDDARIQWQSGATRRGELALSFDAVTPGAYLETRREAPQSDLGALLMKGKVAMHFRGHRADLGTGHVFLHVERLVALCRPLIEAWAARRAFHLRAHVGSCTVGVRLSADERLAVSVSRSVDGGITVPSLSLRAFVDPILDAALALCTAVVQSDRALSRNLRLRALRSEARDLRHWLRTLDRADGKVNDDPSRYQVSPVAADLRAKNEPDLTQSTRLRYAARWRAEIEGLDLAGTLLCGDKLVVPGTRELHALDRATGNAVWSVAAPKASTTLAGEDILRVSGRGEVELRAVSTGEVVWSTRLAPRVGAPILAHAVTAPGLPRVVVVAEGERKLVALDLRTGEARWTFVARHGNTFRLRRAGRLLVVTSGDASVTAIDLASGEVVWRYADRVAFHASALVHREMVFALGGESTRGPARIYALGAFTGAHAWTLEASDPACGLPCATGDTVALPLSTRDGIVLAGYDVGTGDERFRTPLGIAGFGGARPAVTAFDDLVVANLPTGRVVALDAATGATRWTQSFRAPVADDVPRRLDVQLRAGALFVPQSSLAVLRPRDGAVLAEVDACDLVPDLVRVDEHCALYVAEESGHLGCFELGARLRVIRPV
ncbi:MAG: PQQ-like beta-propeller repeat protein [Myxococcales bacterium]|nr:PQQ-like beta-propeller repeat protein [Myxococcales bacterium]